MERTERFRTFQDVQRYREVLQAKRSAHTEGIRTHWRTLGEAEFRSGVLVGTVRSVWKAWNPFSSMRTGIGGSTDMMATLIGLALGSRAKTGWGKALLYAASIASPYVMDNLKGNSRVQHFLEEIQRSWERIKDHWRERRAAHDEPTS